MKTCNPDDSCGVLQPPVVALHLRPFEEWLQRYLRRLQTFKDTSRLTASEGKYKKMETDILLIINLINQALINFNHLPFLHIEQLTLPLFAYATPENSSTFHILLISGRWLDSAGPSVWEVYEMVILRGLFLMSSKHYVSTLEHLPLPTAGKSPLKA